MIKARAALVGASSLIAGLSERLHGVSRQVGQDTPGLLLALAQVPDPRDRRGLIHPLTGLLAIAVAAGVGGQSRITEIAEWAADLPDTALDRLGAVRDPFTGARRAPDDSTFARVLADIDADALDTAICRWLITCSAPGAIPDRRVIAVDGKTLRCSGSPGAQVHLMAALDQHTGIVLAQTDVDGKRTRSPDSFGPQGLEGGELVALAIHLTLAEQLPAGVVDRGEQMDLGAGRATAAQGLAVDRHRACRGGPAGCRCRVGAAWLPSQAATASSRASPSTPASTRSTSSRTA